MQTLPTILLRPGEADRIAAGHPWVYHGSILRLTAPVPDGEVVQVKDHRQRFLGIGFYNSRSKIMSALFRESGPQSIGIFKSEFARRWRFAKALAVRHFLSSGQRGKRFFERLDRRQIRRRIGDADSAWEWINEKPKLRAPGRRFLAARDSGTQ